MSEPDSVTTESLFGNRRLIRQHRNGYRFSIDPVLLSHFACPLPGDRVLDLGTGSAVIPVILTYRIPDLRVVGIEIQNRLFALARETIRENGLDQSVRLIHGDLTNPLVFQGIPPVDFAVSNPPFTPFREGRRNPSGEKALARHEIRVTMVQLTEVAALRLKPGGRFAVIYPASRCEELLRTLKASGLEPRRIRNVHPMPRKPAIRVLVESTKEGKPGLTVCPPLSIFQHPNSYSDEVRAMFL